MSPMLLGMLNTPEIILILVLALVLFGAKKLPELARGLGHGIKEFKKATRDVQDELHNAMNVEPPTPPTPSPPSEPTLPTSEPPVPTTPSAPPVEVTAASPSEPPKA
jgi:sec-independent protein translocase protein TatA